MKCEAMDDGRFYRISLGIIVLFIAGVVLKLAKPVLFPFFLAVFLSYIITPALDALIKLRIPKPLAVLFLVVMAFFAFYLLGALFYSSGKAFAEQLPKYGDRLNSLLELAQKKFHIWRPEQGLISLLNQANLEKIASFALMSLGTFVGFISNLLLVFFFLVFILAGRGSLARKIPRAFGQERAGQLSSILCAVDRQVQQYLAVKTLMSLINGIIVWAVLAIFGVDFAIVFGFLAFLLNYIPNLGSFIAAVLRTAFVFFQFGTIWIPLWILLITVGLDTVIGNLVEPRVIGRRLGLSPLVILFSLLFWGWLWGIPGMILAVPTMAVLRIVCANVPALRPAEVLLGK